MHNFVTHDVSSKVRSDRKICVQVGMCDVSDEGWRKDIAEVSLDLSDTNSSLLITDGETIGEAAV